MRILILIARIPVPLILIVRILIVGHVQFHTTRKKIDRTNNDVADLQDSFDSQRRLTGRKISDLEQTLTQVQNQLKELLDPEKKKK